MLQGRPPTSLDYRSASIIVQRQLQLQRVRRNGCLRFRRKKTTDEVLGQSFPLLSNFTMDTLRVSHHIKHFFSTGSINQLVSPLVLIQQQQQRSLRITGMRRPTKYRHSLPETGSIRIVPRPSLVVQHCCVVLVTYRWVPAVCVLISFTCTHWYNKQISLHRH